MKKYDNLLKSYKHAVCYEHAHAKEHYYDIVESSLSDHIAYIIFNELEDDIKNRYTEVITKRIDERILDCNVSFELTCKSSDDLDERTIVSMINNDEINIKDVVFNKDENATYFVAYISTQLQCLKKGGFNDL